MTVTRVHLNLETHGNAEIHNITAAVQQAVTQAGLSDGAITIFAPSATSALTTGEEDKWSETK